MNRVTVPAPLSTLTAATNPQQRGFFRYKHLMLIYIETCQGILKFSQILSP